MNLLDLLLFLPRSLILLLSTAKNILYISISLIVIYTAYNLHTPTRNLLSPIVNSASEIHISKKAKKLGTSVGQGIGLIENPETVGGRVKRRLNELPGRAKEDLRAVTIWVANRLVDAIIQPVVFAATIVILGYIGFYKR